MTTTADIRAGIEQIGQDFVSHDDAWNLVELATATVLPEYSLVSWDGIFDGLFAPVSDEIDENTLYRLLVHTVADVKSVIVLNAILG